MGTKETKLNLLKIYERSDLYDISLTSFYCSDLHDTVTIREYLRRLLSTLLIEEEGFSGKRPFGNSGWKYDLYRALISGGYIQGTIDPSDDFDISDEDRDVADELILMIARSL